MSNFSYNFSLGSAGTVTAAAADITVANHILNIGATTLAPLPGRQTIDVRLIEKAALVTAVAETAAVWTITPTAAASQEFSILITQIINGTPKQMIATAYSLASGSTATTICNDLRAQINANTTMKVTATGTTTLILTAQSTYPLIASVSQVSLGTTPGTFASITNGTPGVAAKGTYAALIAQGVDSTIIVAGQSYSNFRLLYKASSSNDAGGNVSQMRILLNLYINVGALNYTALATRITEIMSGFGASVTTADPEFLDITGN
jgi:hypothetical protein